MREHFFDNTRQLVVKIGSRVLGDKPGVIRSLASDLAYLRQEKKDVRVILVSSGAIATGMKVMGLKKRPVEIARLQALAAIGQPELMQAYHKAFAKHGLKLAQMLLTWEDFSDRKRYSNMRHTMDALMRDGVIPIINENDTVSTREIEFGDNDQLSSMVAAMCEADLLVLLTDANGFYADYAKGASTRLGMIDDLNDQVFAAVRDKKNTLSKGGMLSKLKAVEKSINKGTPCLLADGRERHILKKLFEGRDRGTLFLPKVGRMSSKKHWICYVSRPEGTLVVDDGAKEALLNRGKSLLSKGIQDIRGHFKAGASVEIKDGEGKVLGKGIVNFDTDELKKILGLKSDAWAEALGHACVGEVLHRDNFVAA